jgi:hypothetical protein
MYSRKYPPLHPRFVTDAQPTTTVITPVSSVASGAAPALLSIPIADLNLDGGKVALFLSGRATIYTGSNPGALAVNLYNGTVFDINHRIASISAWLPANASGVVLPFSLSVQAVWDVKTQKLYGLYWGVVDPANNRNFGWTPFAIPVVVNPNSMNFAAAWGFSQAPLTNTTVEILEFRLG